MEMVGLRIEPDRGDKCGHGEANPCYEGNTNDVLKINAIG